MPTFHYTAKRGPREVVEGSLDAQDRGGAFSRLAELGFVPIRIEEQTAGAEPSAAAVAPGAPAGRVGRVPGGHLAAFTRQFASLVRSQVPILRTLELLEEQSRHPSLRAVLRRVAEAVRQGSTLSGALEQYPEVFSPLYVSLIHSGEISGSLEAVLERLAVQVEHEQILRGKIRAALTYPAFVGLVGCGTIVFFLTFVMPRLSVQLAGLGQRLPAATKALLIVTAWLSGWWFWAAIAGLVLAGVGAWQAAGERARRARDRALLRVPVLGPFVQQVELARFARSLGLLLNDGVPVLRAIDVAIPAIRHRHIRAQLERLPEGLRQGRALSACLRDLPAADPFLVNTVAVGEEGGRVGEALAEVANHFERESDRLLQLFATLLEPALIVVVGAIVGFIVMAVLLPIFDMSSVVR
jgi:general secretion pathway protein F